MLGTAVVLRHAPAQPPRCTPGQGKDLSVLQGQRARSQAEQPKPSGHAGALGPRRQDGLSSSWRQSVSLGLEAPGWRGAGGWHPCPRSWTCPRVALGSLSAVGSDCDVSRRQGRGAGPGAAPWGPWCPGCARGARQSAVRGCRRGLCPFPTCGPSAPAAPTLELAPASASVGCWGGPQQHPAQGALPPHLYSFLTGVLYERLE